MSYSFSIKAKNADEAKTKVAEQFATIIESQPIHARDCAAAIKAIRELAAIITIPEGKVLAIGCSGSVGWSGQMGEDLSALELNGAGLNISVSLADAPVEKIETREIVGQEDVGDAKDVLGE